MVDDDDASVLEFNYEVNDAVQRKRNIHTVHSYPDIILLFHVKDAGNLVGIGAYLGAEGFQKVVHVLGSLGLCCFHRGEFVGKPPLVCSNLVQIVVCPLSEIHNGRLQTIGPCAEVILEGSMVGVTGYA